MLQNQRVSLSLPHSSLRHGTCYRLSFSSGQELWLACQPAWGPKLKSEYVNSRKKSTDMLPRQRDFMNILAEWCNRSWNIQIRRLSLIQKELKTVPSRTGWAIQSTSVKDKVPLEVCIRKYNDRCDYVLHIMYLLISSQNCLPWCLGPNASWRPSWNWLG